MKPIPVLLSGKTDRSLISQPEFTCRPDGRRVTVQSIGVQAPECPRLMESGADGRRPGAWLVHPWPAGHAWAATSFLTHPGHPLRGEEEEPELPADHAATEWRHKQTASPVALSKVTAANTSHHHPLQGINMLKCQLSPAERTGRPGPPESKGLESCFPKLLLSCCVTWARLLYRSVLFSLLYATVSHPQSAE